MAVSLDDFSALVSYVTGLEEKLHVFLDIIGTVGTISEELGAIARQTRMLGINAAVEAARGGEATKGFAVVADEIRHLANRATDSTASVSEQLGELDMSARELISGVAASISTWAARPAARSTSCATPSARSRCSSPSSRAARPPWPKCNDESARKVTVLDEGFAQFCVDASKNAREAQTAHDRLDQLESHANGMLNRIAHQAVATRNTPFIDMALKGAAEVSALIGEALEERRPDPGRPVRHRLPADQTAPTPSQYMTRFVPFADARLQADVRSA